MNALDLTLPEKKSKQILNFLFERSLWFRLELFKEYVWHLKKREPVPIVSRDIITISIWLNVYHLIIGTLFFNYTFACDFDFNREVFFIIISGCDGNLNNFATIDECEAVCDILIQMAQQAQGNLYFF